MSEQHSVGHPQLTVVLTNYNGRGLLEQMLPSLAGQTFQEFETIVVDDCSTDDSVHLYA